MVLPNVVVSSQEAIKAVPNYLREASYGLGATKWTTVRKIVLPSAIPGIMTGSILALSRAIGETAPFCLNVHTVICLFIIYTKIESFLNIRDNISQLLLNYTQILEKSLYP